MGTLGRKPDTYQSTYPSSKNRLCFYILRYVASDFKRAVKWRAWVKIDRVVEVRRKSEAQVRKYTYSLHTPLRDISAPHHQNVTRIILFERPDLNLHTMKLLHTFDARLLNKMSVFLCKLAGFGSTRWFPIWAGFQPTGAKRHP